MVMLTPATVALGLGGADMLLGGVSSLLGGAAARQEYAAQRAFQTANTRFAQWQAGFSQRFANANAQYNYWQETVNWNQQVAYSKSLRNFETLKAVEQARVVAETRANAAAAFVGDSAAISEAAAEASMAEAVAFHQFQLASLQARGRALANEQEGKSAERMINDFARQVGDYQAIMEINQRLRGRQYSRQQAAAVAEYLNRYNSQQFYAEQPSMEPVAPFAPLPALLEAPPPTMTGAGPSGLASGLRLGSAVLSGVQTGLGAYKGLAIK
ncbi:MAG: hypothetical protein FJ083_11130 [Cyanobacteria bacterium K_Offshore_surface_m2_239]|nr:hypothetical protein [Cyanobacteria bacterium K_Offshore_surface_m2_239]